MCYHAQIGRSSLKSEVIDRGELQKLGSAGARLHSGGRGCPLKTIPSYMCYHIKFSSSTTKGVRIKIKEPQNWKLGTLGFRLHWSGAWLCSNFPVLVVVPNLVAVRQRVYT